MSVLKKKGIEEMDGKPYLKCQVLLIPTEDETAPIKKWQEKLVMDNLPGISKHYHLAILNYEEDYKKGDLICRHNGIEGTEHIIMSSVDYNPLKSIHWPIVVACTDRKLGLPLPSESFVKKYVEMHNKNKKISQVMIEGGVARDGKTGRDEFFILTDRYYTITTRKVKDNWNDEEVIQLIEILIRNPGVMINASSKEDGAQELFKFARQEF